MNSVLRLLQRWARVAAIGEVAMRMWRWILVACVVAVTYLALMPVPPTSLTTGWDKLNHAIAFMALSFSGCLGFYGTRWGRAGVILVMFIFGGAIEILQMMVPGRTAEWADLVIDVVGIACGVVLAQGIFKLAKVSPGRIY